MSTWSLTQLIILSVCSTLGWDQWCITQPCPTGLGDYTHTPLIGICWTIFPSANCVLKSSKIFQPTDVQSNSPLGGNQTHDLRRTISDPDHSASGALEGLLWMHWKPKMWREGYPLGSSSFWWTWWDLVSLCWHVGTDGFRGCAVDWDKPIQIGCSNRSSKS
jgi:hypothetical protein